MADFAFYLTQLGGWIVRAPHEGEEGLLCDILGVGGYERESRWG